MDDWWWGSVSAPTVRDSRQRGPVTAGCYRSRRQSVGGVVPPRSPFCLLLAYNDPAGARRVMLTSLRSKIRRTGAAV